MRESEARYRLMAEHAQDVIMQYDAQGIVRYVSPSIISLGLRPDEVVGGSLLKFAHPQDLPLVQERLAKVSSGDVLGPDNRVELRFRRPDGTWAWVQGSPSPIFDAEGRPIGVVSIMRDVSERRRLEEQLRESELRYRQLAEQSADLIIRYDVDGNVEFVSQAGRQFGIDPERIVGRNFRDLVPDYDRARNEAFFADLKAGLVPPQGDRNIWRTPLRGGRFVDFEGATSPIYDGDRIVGAVATLRDVTARLALQEALEREKAETERALEALKDSEARYRALADNASDLIIRVDMDGRIEFASRSVSAFGYRPEDVIGHMNTEFVHPDDDPAAAGAALEQGQTHYELRIKCADGSWAWVQGLPTEIRDDAGELVGMMSVLRDITEQRRLEVELAGRRADTERYLELLRESEARYRTLAENAGDVLARFDTQGVIEYVSPSVSTLGYRPEDMIGRNTREFVHPEDRPEDIEAAVLLREVAPPEDENRFRLRRGDGRGWALLQGHPSPLRDESGKVVGVVTVLRDITRQDALETELRRKEAEAQAAVVAKSEFLATMSHEIRTPLTAVVGFSSLLAKMADLPEKARVYIDRIARSGEALASIVNDVLDFSKIEAGQVELRPEPFDVQAFADEVLDVVGDSARGKGLTLSSEVGGPASGRVLADAPRLRQVVLNLLTNAIKFTPAGKVTLTIRHSRRMLHVRVADTGIGISPEAAGRLFQRFSQVESSNARRFGGAGLGLAISRGLVELMGGEIGVESVEGQGSQFWFRIPAPAAGALAIARESEMPELPAGARVLVVDDARANRELIMALLSPFDLQLTEAADGLEALEVTRNNPFDLVLMDLQMPGLDGIAAARAIRSGCELNSRTPIVAVSASVQPSDVEACHQAGMDDHIGKPISPRELVGKVAYWIGAPQGPGSARVRSGSGR